MDPIVLRVEGSCPSKKNEWQRSRSGGMYLPDAVAQPLAALQFQLQALWNRRPALSRVRIHARFFVLAGRQDADNIYQALQDLLVKAGILVNDSIKHVRQFEVSVFVGSVERIEIYISDEIEAVQW